VLHVTKMTFIYYHRNLPHWQPEGQPIFLTWRLHGSLPKGFTSHLRKWENEPAKQFLAADLKLDAASTGPRWLSDPKIAAPAEHAIRRGAELGHYVLHAYVVMPNHIHMLLNPLVPLRRITGGIKVSQPEKPMAYSGVPESRSGRVSRVITGFAILHNLKR